MLSLTSRFVVVGKEFITICLIERLPILPEGEEVVAITLPCCFGFAIARPRSMKTISILILLLFVVPLSAQIRTPEQGTPDRLTIDKAVAEALENNLKLIVERANVPIAQAQLTTARLRPNPVLSLYGDLLPLAGTQFNSTNNAGPPEGGVRTDFVVETAGKRNKRIEVAQSSVWIAQLRVKDTMR